MRILCVIASMEAGGAQRVMAHLSGHLAAEGGAVALVSLVDAHEASFFPLHPAIQPIQLGRAPYGDGAARLQRVARWVRRLRVEIRRFRPDVILSFIDTTNIVTLLAARGLGVPVIVSERIDPAGYAHRLSRQEHLLRRWTYPWADAVVMQTQRSARAIRGIAPHKRAVLPNPVPAMAAQARPGEAGPDGRFRIIGVGRLDEQKGFDLLLPAFAGLAVRYPQWDLDIFGEGPERALLQATIDALGLSGRVRLRGTTTAIGSELAAAHVLAFPSRYEGFPNALAEAMAAGLPSIAFRDVSGVEDLLGSGQAGLMVAGQPRRAPLAATEAFMGALETLMRDDALRVRMGQRAASDVRAFGPAVVLPRWSRLLEDVVAGTRGAEVLAPVLAGIPVASARVR